MPGAFSPLPAQSGRYCTFSAVTAKARNFPVVFLLFLALFVCPMGLANTLNTLMNTAYRLFVLLSLLL